MSRLSNLVLNAAKTVPPSERNGSKVWIHHVHEVITTKLHSHLSLDRFKQEIINDVDCRSLLSRCDMPYACGLSKVDQSNTLYLDGSHTLATYNYVRLANDDYTQEIDWNSAC